MKDLLDLLKLENIADELEERQLIEIGQKVKLGFEDDLESSRKWMDDVKKVLQLAQLDAPKKNYPLPDSSNILFPTITKAVYQYSADTYPEIVKDGTVVKTRVIGKDFTGEKQKQAKRVSDYMNYQLLFANEDWEQDLDKLLTRTALIGFICRKTYYDPINECIKSEICDYEDLIINSKVKSLQDAPRISHILRLSINDTIEYMRAGLFCEEPIKELIEQYGKTQDRPKIDFIEQHGYLDLDGDDYEEPYIITCIKESGKVVRILPRFEKSDIKRKNDKISKITPTQYFTDYHFLVSPNGQFQSVGFGILLRHLNETINSLLNMITDAGKLANLQVGYMDARAKMIETGSNDFAPGELKKLKTAPGASIADSIHLLAFKEPSNVLYQTLGLLIAAAKDLSSSTEVMTGGSSTENTKTGAVLALQEAGRKVLTGIQKRLYRSLTAEYRKIFKLNATYLDPKVYINILDDELAISQDDFDDSKVNILPVADPNLSSEAQKIAKAQFLASTIQFPGVKSEKITRRIYESTNIENYEELLLDDKELESAKQQPNPEIIKLQADIEKSAQDIKLRARELDLQEKDQQLKAYEIQCKCLELKSQAILNISQAQAQQNNGKFQEYQLQLDALSKHLDVLNADKQRNADLEMHYSQMNNDRQLADQEATNEQQNSGMAPPSSEQISPESYPTA